MIRADKCQYYAPFAFRPLETVVVELAKQFNKGL